MITNRRNFGSKQVRLWLRRLRAGRGDCFFLGIVLVIGVLVYWLFPVSWLATPRWEVVVVDERGKPVEGITGRLGKTIPSRLSRSSVPSRRHLEVCRFHLWAIEFALPVETNEVLPREVDGLDIAGPHNPVFADVLHNLLKKRCRGMFQHVIS